jgi:hypothetical protein
VATASWTSAGAELALRFALGLAPTDPTGAWLQLYSVGPDLDTGAGTQHTMARVNITSWTIANTGPALYQSNAVLNQVVDITFDAAGPFTGWAIFSEEVGGTPMIVGTLTTPPDKSVDDVVRFDIGDITVRITS